MTFAKSDKYQLIENTNLSDLERYRAQIAQSKDRKRVLTLEERLKHVESAVSKMADTVEALVRKIDG